MPPRSSGASKCLYIKPPPWSLRLTTGVALISRPLGVPWRPSKLACTIAGVVLTSTAPAFRDRGGVKGMDVRWRRRDLVRWATLLAGTVTLGACGEDAGVVQTRAARTIFATQTAAVTPTPVPTATVTPSPTPSPTPIPTATLQPTPTVTPTPAPAIADIVSAMTPSVVFVLVQVAGKPVSGSGFIVSAAGQVVTNLHVVEGASTIKVYVGDRPFTATVTSSSRANDLAVLQVDGTGLQPVRLGDSGVLRVGQGILAFGFPYADEIGSAQVSVTRGIISRLGAKVYEVPDGIQIDAALNPGSSGGPVVNLAGEVIGVSVAKLTRATGINFAIPIAHLLSMLGR